MLAGGMRWDVTEQLCILFSGYRRREEERRQGGLCPHIHFISDGWPSLFSLDRTTATGSLDRTSPTTHTWNCSGLRPFWIEVFISREAFSLVVKSIHWLLGKPKLWGALKECSPYYLKGYFLNSRTRGKGLTPYSQDTWQSLLKEISV